MYSLRDGCVQLCLWYICSVILLFIIYGVRLQPDTIHTTAKIEKKQPHATKIVWRLVNEENQN